MMKRVSLIFISLILIITASVNSFAASQEGPGSNRVISPIGNGNTIEETVSVKAPGSKKLEDKGNGLLDGVELMMLSSQSDSQILSAVITTTGGEVIVIDGGTEYDAPHLKEVLMAKGGRVKAWFITHPHSDHIGALDKLIKDGLKGLTIENVYYKFSSAEWYQTNECYRADFVIESAGLLNRLGAAAHPDITKGQIINIDNVSVKVLNEPYLFANNSINNSSIAYMFTINNNKRILFTGDIGTEAGSALLRDLGEHEICADIVQLSHHGQSGAGYEFYRAVNPSIALWFAPAWLYDNTSGQYQTIVTKSWMKRLGVKENYCTRDGDVTIR